MISNNSSFISAEEIQRWEGSFWADKQVVFPEFGPQHECDLPVEALLHGDVNDSTAAKIRAAIVKNPDCLRVENGVSRIVAKCTAEQLRTIFNTFPVENPCTKAVIDELLKCNQDTLASDIVVDALTQRPSWVNNEWKAKVFLECVNGCKNSIANIFLKASNVQSTVRALCEAEIFFPPATACNGLLSCLEWIDANNGFKILVDNWDCSRSDTQELVNYLLNHKHKEHAVTLVGRVVALDPAWLTEEKKMEIALEGAKRNAYGVVDQFRDQLDPNFEDTDGSEKTLFMYVAQNGWLGLTATLASRKADVFHKDAQEKTVLHLIKSEAPRYKSEMIRAIVKEQYIDDENTNELLHLLIELGEEKLANELCQEMLELNEEARPKWLYNEELASEVYEKGAEKGFKDVVRSVTPFVDPMLACPGLANDPDVKKVLDLTVEEKELVRTLSMFADSFEQSESNS